MIKKIKKFHWNVGEEAQKHVKCRIVQWIDDKKKPVVRARVKHCFFLRHSPSLLLEMNQKYCVYFSLCLNDDTFCVRQTTETYSEGMYICNRTPYVCVCSIVMKRREQYGSMAIRWQAVGQAGRVKYRIEGKTVSEKLLPVELNECNNPWKRVSKIRVIIYTINKPDKL